jgi:hypothetical protein
LQSVAAGETPENLALAGLANIGSRSATGSLEAIPRAVCLFFKLIAYSSQQQAISKAL